MPVNVPVACPLYRGHADIGMLRTNVLCCATGTAARPCQLVAWQSLLESFSLLGSSRFFINFNYTT